MVSGIVSEAVSEEGGRFLNILELGFRSRQGQGGQKQSAHGNDDRSGRPVAEYDNHKQRHSQHHGKRTNDGRRLIGCAPHNHEGYSGWKQNAAENVKPALNPGQRCSVCGRIIL